MIRVTIRHRYDFGPDRRLVGSELATAESWDALRESSGAFGLPKTRGEWAARAARADLAARARDLVALVREASAHSLCSYGAGAGLLEKNVAELAPDVSLVCADFAPKTVARLREYLPTAEVVEHDLLRDDPLQADFHLMHRIDTEFSAEEWSAILPDFAKPILFVPSLVLTWRLFAGEVVRLLPGARTTPAGYARNEAALRALWARSHDDRRVLVGGAPGFLLSRR